MALTTWFIRTMRSADTTLDVNKPVSNLVQDGPFRYSRNPGYLSLAMIYAGIAILRNALWAILLLPLLLVVTQRELIEREERYLERTFGPIFRSFNWAPRRFFRRWGREVAGSVRGQV
jgi:protein-S-isoprenylcysteine O-methyltransferase Ste14